MLDSREMNLGHPMLRFVAFAAIAGVLSATACSSDDESPPMSTPIATLRIEDASERGEYGVGVRTYELVDTSRPTAPNGEYAGASERALPIEVWYPAAVPSEVDTRDAPVASDRPYPLIIFAHGFSSLGRVSASYASHLASHGYVVVAPDFPSSKIGALGGPTLAAVAEQPADVSFVIDTLLAYNAEADHPLGGAIDPESVGMSGHSLGGLTALVTAFGARRDDRIDAILPIAPPACFLPADVAGDARVPMLLITGGKDGLVNPQNAHFGFEYAAGPRDYVEVAGAEHVRWADIDTPDSELPSLDEILGGDLVADAIATAAALGGDVGKCVGGRDTSGGDLITADRQREILNIFATAFFDAELKDDAAAAALLEQLPSLVPEVAVESAAE